VQQNAAMVEQATAATHSLKRDANELKRLISRFQVDGDTGRGGPELAGAHSQPAPSPARAMGHKLAVSFGDGSALRQAR
jgi:methyl-accepting chemotaxis protein